MVGLALATAHWLGYRPDLLLIVYACIGAVAAHVSVNAFNEYLDFISGLDAQTRRTPFSGGSGALPENPHLANRVLELAIAALVVSASIGLFFAWYRGPMMLVPGIAGLALVIFYTNWITRQPLLCLLAPGFGFGPVMIIGSYMVFTGEYSWPAVIVSLPAFFLVNNLLLMNQYPDIEPDRRAGRRHLLIAFGPRVGLYVYAVFALLPYVVLGVAVWMHYLPHLGLIALLALPASLFSTLRLAVFLAHGTPLQPGLAANVVASLLYPLLLATGLLLA